MGRHGRGEEEREAEYAADLELSVGHQERGRGWGYTALVLVLVVAAGLIGWRVAALFRPGSATEVVATQSRHAGQSASASAQPSPAGTGAAPAMPSATPSPTPSNGPRVHVVGAVRDPGLYLLAPDARVDDAVRAAGGATDRADLSGVNLAAEATDGSQVVVPVEGETPAAGPEPSAAAPPGTQAVSGASPPEVVGLNSADEATLQTLPGIGPAMAARLIEFRESHGGFRSAADLDAVEGIGPAMLEKLQGKVAYD